MDIFEQKKALRAQMFGVRKMIDPAQKQEYDHWVNASLSDLIAARNCEVVHVYIPMGNEIDIRPLIQQLLDQHITVVSPKTLPKRKLEHRVLSSLEKLETGIMGTQHPADAVVYNGNIDLIVVPGMAFDTANYRLGYGGGYYDNFIITQPAAYKVGIFYPFQKVEHVPVESHDIQLDQILATAF
jgi:5-formyltetrahydrofolate cyclo-ligase